MQRMNDYEKKTLNHSVKYKNFKENLAHAITLTIPYKLCKIMITNKNFIGHVAVGRWVAQDVRSSELHRGEHFQ